jgi:NTE family protein
VVEEVSARQKIGLALSGGGARGITHIGVLKALEELRVPIDYIAGTSMGSIVGGLYASGLSTEQLDKAVNTIDWENIFNFEINRDQLSYREKQNQRRFFNFEFGFTQKGLAIPSGFIGGEKMFLELKRLTKGINTDFSTLPIPFNAVATDLNTAKPYILEKGDLALALRASMAVPFIFAPVEIDDHVLVDGNILNNLPVDVVKEMGADIIIAINISTPLEEIRSESSLLDVARQALDVALIQNTRRILQEANIVVTPDLEGFMTTDFTKGSAMIEKGYEAIMKKAMLFKGLAINASDYTAYRNAIMQEKPEPLDTVTPEFVHFTSNERTAKESLQDKLHYLVGRNLVIDDIEYAIHDLMALNDFEQITYDIVRDKQNKEGLLFNIQEKPWGPHYFRLGLNATTSFDDKAEFSILVRHERLNIGSLGAEWINETKLGTSYEFFTEFYQPLDHRRRFFVAPYAVFGRFFLRSRTTTSKHC